MGRPKFQIDYETVEKLASIMCTQKEIASFLGCSTDTLKRDEKFCTIYKKGQDTGKMSLRRYQWKLAEKNTAMAIWLGKQYLEQKDKVEYTDDGMKEINKNIINIADLINHPVKRRTEETMKQKQE